MSKEYFLQIAEKVIAERSTIDKQFVADLAFSFSNIYSAGYNNAKNHIPRREPYKKQTNKSIIERAREVNLVTAKRTLDDGTPVNSYYKALKENGQQENYIVFSKKERDKGFVRPLRNNYIHLTCGQTTIINSTAIIETYAHDPKFYSTTFCCSCGKHYPVNEFVWEETNEKVGS